MKEPNRQRKNPIKEINKLSLNEEQKEAKRLIWDYQVVIITGAAGCLSYGTKVLMYDGTYKEVQDILIGDKLMGIDSTPRKVISLYRGRQQMYWVRQNKGLDYRVNENHILSLVRNIPARYSRFTDKNNFRKIDYSKEPLKQKESSIVNISVIDYLSLPNNIKNKQLKGYICNTIEFNQQ